MLLRDRLQSREPGADLAGPAVRDDGRPADAPTRRRRRSSGRCHRDWVRRVDARGGRRTPGFPSGRVARSLRLRAVTPSQPRAASMTLSSTFRCTAAIAHHALHHLAASRLELRLHEDERLPARPREPSTGGSAFVTLMNETSQTTSSGENGSSVSVRAFTRSRTVTRGSDRSRGWSWPYPTSIATTRAARPGGGSP